MIDSEDARNDAQVALDNECAEFQALMPELVGAGDDLQKNEHMQTCERCSALFNDLQQIAIAARELMGVYTEPSRDLWIDLDKAIERGDDPDHGPEPLAAPVVS